MEELKKVLDVDGQTIPPYIFILFAEYLGYISKMYSGVENWANGEKEWELDDYEKKLITTEALNMFHKMKEKLTLSEIQHRFEQIAPIALSKYLKA